MTWPECEAWLPLVKDMGYELFREVFDELVEKNKRTPLHFEVNKRWNFRKMKANGKTVVMENVEEVDSLAVYDRKKEKVKSALLDPKFKKTFERQVVNASNSFVRDQYKKNGLDSTLVVETALGLMDPPTLR